MFNLKDPHNFDKRKPILIAHRGGVISTDSPENSLAAIRLASERGYDMVELDVREAKDHVPMLYHGFGPKFNLLIDCGVDQNFADLSSDQLARVTYRLTMQPVASLSDALALCADLDLGVMLDIKTSAPSDEFLMYIAELVERNGLGSCTVTLNRSHRVEQFLRDSVIFPLRAREYSQLLDGEAGDLHGRYYFEWGSRIDAQTVRLVQESGAFVIAAINFFHYPKHAKMASAAQDIDRLVQAGVDGFQIDDEFEELVIDKR